MFDLQPAQKPHRTKEEYVYDTLRAAIMRCDLKPGEKLVIDALSVALQVSPIPIRGALQRLQAEGLVKIIPYTGAVVSEMSPDTVDEIFLLLEVLESVAFRVATPKASEAEIERLEQLVEAMEKAYQVGDTDRWSDLNMEFHRLVAQMTQMKLLIEFTGRVWDNWNRLRHCYLKPIVSARMPQSQAEHRQMIELLERGDTDGLSALAMKHNSQARETYQQLIRDQYN
jgi:DNA-binding GntR family transcriptional regulator